MIPNVKSSSNYSFLFNIRPTSIEIKLYKTSIKKSFRYYSTQSEIALPLIPLQRS